MAIGGLLVVVLVLLGIVLAVIAVVRRVMDRDSAPPADGNDLVVYLVLALAMGVAGFALARLAASAFPAGGLVVDPARDLASSLPALIVASPFVVFFWRRQAQRRETFPNSVGWGVYLTLILLVFGIAFVATGVVFLDGLFGDNRAEWTGMVVFAALLAVHEFAARRTPPQGDAGEIYQVVGSAIGLFTLGIGLVGTLGAGIFSALFDAIWSDFGGQTEWLPWTAMVIIGGPFWVYYWFRSWQSEPGLPRHTWTIATSAMTILMAIGGAVGAVVTLTQIIIEDSRSAFEALPFLLAASLVGVSIWIIHRRAMGQERTNALRTYEYLVAAVALGSTIASGVTLTQLALGDRTIVGGDASDVLLITFWLIASALTWLWFHSRSVNGAPEDEATAWPRRLYLLGVGAIMGIASAIALIAALVVVIRRTLDGVEGGSLLIPLTTFILAGLAAWYLLALFAQTREYTESEDVIAPFDVTIVCAHPGPLGAMFPKQAKIKVIHRADESGVVTEELAASIVSAVGHRSSLVWVDDEGVRVAPVRAN